MILISQARSRASFRSTCIAAMRPYRIVLVCTFAGCTGGCAPSSAPALTSGSAPIETGTTADTSSGQVPVETAIFVQGTATEADETLARQYALSGVGSKIVSDRSALLRSWNVNLALNSSSRAGFTLQPPRWPLGEAIQSAASLLQRW